MMDSANQPWPERITVSPDICNGKPSIRGLRVTAQTILEFLAAGDSPEEILAEYPSLEPEDILACYQAAANILSHGFVTLGAAR